jgi:xylulokinase
VAAAVPSGCDGVKVLPFVYPEPSRGVTSPRFEWTPQEPTDPGVRFRAALEALAYLIALGLREHEAAGQQVSRVSMSGGIARSELMGTILATVLGRPVERLVSSEGPALGAAAAALAGLETYLRDSAGDLAAFTVADSVARMVRFRKPATPRADWRATYDAGLREFERRLEAET